MSDDDSQQQQMLPEPEVVNGSDGGSGGDAPTDGDQARELTNAEQSDIWQRQQLEMVRQETQFEGDIGGLIVDGTDVRKREVADVQRRRKGAWRGVGMSANATISFEHATKAFNSKIQSLVLSGEMRKYIVFMIMFLIFFLTGRDVTSNYYFAKSYKDPLLGSEIALLKVAKYFPDIAEAFDFNNWIQDVFLIQMIDPQYVTGAHFDVGAFRVRTQRVRPDSCSINNEIIPTTMPAAALECYGAWSDENGDDGTASNTYNQVGRWKYKTCADMGYGTVTSGQMASYNCGGYFFEVPWWRNATNAASEDMPFPSKNWERVPFSVTQDLYITPALEHNPPFIDDLATRFVVVEFFAYQPSLETFFSFKLFAEQAAGGLWHTNYQARVLDVFTVSVLSIAKVVFDIAFAFFVLHYIYRFIIDMTTFRKKEGRLLAFFFDTWNFLELVNLGIFMAVFGFRISWMIRCMSTDLQIDKLVYTPRYPVELEDILDTYMMQIYLNGINTVLSFLKLLKYFRLNDRLNVLTRTLGESQDSIIGVLLIFFLVVTAFAMTGHGLFGLGVWQFRSIDASYSTLLQMLVGSFDYPAMKNENRVLAGFFFWSYIILGLFCLLNFLIGVLMEAFAEVSKSRSILPLDTVLVKTWEDFKKLCNPTAIMKELSASWDGNSREDLLQRTLECLQEYRLDLFPPNDPTTIDEDKQLLSRAIYYQALPEDLVVMLGEEYAEYVWNDLVYEWDQSEGAQEAIDAQRNLAMTAQGVKLAIGPHMEVLESLPARMAKLEQNLIKVAGLLDA
jgi:hypothetical protein